MGPAVCYGPGAISMKEDWVQGAPLHLHTQLHILVHFVPHTTAAGKDCPLQSSFCAVYRYLSPWYGVQNTPVGQRVKHQVQTLLYLKNITSSSPMHNTCMFAFKNLPPSQANLHRWGAASPPLYCTLNTDKTRDGKSCVHSKRM